VGEGARQAKPRVCLSIQAVCATPWHECCAVPSLPPPPTLAAVSNVRILTAGAREGTLDAERSVRLSVRLLRLLRALVLRILQEDLFTHRATLDAAAAKEVHEEG
jgi:hypothetical protein